MQSQTCHNSNQKGPPHEQLNPAGTPRGYRFCMCVVCTFLLPPPHVTPAIKRPEVLWRALFAPFQVSRSFSCHFRPARWLPIRPPIIYLYLYTLSHTIIYIYICMGPVVAGLDAWASHFLYIFHVHHWDHTEQEDGGRSGRGTRCSSKPTDNILEHIPVPEVFYY